MSKQVVTMGEIHGMLSGALERYFRIDLDNEPTALGVRVTIQWRGTKACALDPKGRIAHVSFVVSPDEIENETADFTEKVADAVAQLMSQFEDALTPKGVQ